MCKAALEYVYGSLAKAEEFNVYRKTERKKGQTLVVDKEGKNTLREQMYKDILSRLQFSLPTVADMSTLHHSKEEDESRETETLTSRMWKYSLVRLLNKVWR